MNDIDNAVYEELKRIEEEHDGLEPPTVVREARPEDSPIHHKFEWDDQTGAEQFRLIQARNLIRAVRVFSVGEDENDAPHAFVHVTMTDDEGEKRTCYKSLAIVANEPDLAQSAIWELMRKIAQLQRSVGEIYEATSGPRRVRVRRALDAVMAARKEIDAIYPSPG